MSRRHDDLYGPRRQIAKDHDTLDRGWSAEKGGRGAARACASSASTSVDASSRARGAAVGERHEGLMSSCARCSPRPAPIRRQVSSHRPKGDITTRQNLVAMMVEAPLRGVRTGTIRRRQVPRCAGRAPARHLAVGLLTTNSPTEKRHRTLQERSRDDEIVPSVGRANEEWGRVGPTLLPRRRVAADAKDSSRPAARRAEPPGPVVA